MYDETLTWQEIAEFQFDQELLRSAVDELSTYAHRGICDIAYAVLQPDFNYEENAKLLAETLFKEGGTE